MTQNASFVYHALLVDDAATNVQQRVFQYASHNKDIELMIKLSHLANLDPSIDEALSKRQEAEVLAAWASRKGRTTEALIERFAKEKRATLLSQLASRSDLPEALYLQIAEHDSAAVGEAIISNQHAPEAARVIAAKNALRSVRASWSTSSRVVELFRGAPTAAAVAAIEHTPTLHHLSGLMQCIEPQHHLQVVEQAVALLVAKSGELDYSIRSNLDQIWSRLGAENRTILVDSINAAVSAGSLSFDGGGYFLKDIVNRPVIDPVERAINVITTSDDESDLRIAINDAVNNGAYHQRREALHRAVLNEKVPTDAIVAHLNYIDRDDVGHLAARVIDNDDLVVTLLETNSSAVVHVLQAAGRDFRSYVRKVAAGSDTPMWARYLVSSLGDPAFALETLGAREVIGDYTFSPAARALMLERLGEDNSRWELLERLIGEWSGTLPGLLDMIENV